VWLQHSTAGQPGHAADDLNGREAGRGTIEVGDHRPAGPRVNRLAGGRRPLGDHLLGRRVTAEDRDPDGPDIPADLRLGRPPQLEPGDLGRLETGRQGQGQHVTGVVPQGAPRQQCLDEAGGRTGPHRDGRLRPPELGDPRERLGQHDLDRPRRPDPLDLRREAEPIRKARQPVLGRLDHLRTRRLEHPCVMSRRHRTPIKSTHDGGD
jgi:hypothetical protein